LSGTGWNGDTARSGTQFNFTKKRNIGAELHLNKRLSLQTRARHFHLSNGNIKGIQRNPSHDNSGFFLGLLFIIKDDCH
jgi:Lipid A 3-O-deacylase (PagL)